jgi:hypothetical protein
MASSTMPNFANWVSGCVQGLMVLGGPAATDPVVIGREAIVLEGMAIDLGLKAMGIVRETQIGHVMPVIGRARERNSPARRRRIMGWVVRPSADAWQFADLRNPPTVSYPL